jgi:hypothetical protein
MKLDLDKGTLRFWLDGKQHGLGFMSGVTGSVVWLVGLLNLGSGTGTDGGIGTVHMQVQTHIQVQAQVEAQGIGIGTRAGIGAGTGTSAGTSTGTSTGIGRGTGSHTPLISLTY